MYESSSSTKNSTLYIVTCLCLVGFILGGCRYSQQTIETDSIIGDQTENLNQKEETVSTPLSNPGQVSSKTSQTACGKYTLHYEPEWQLITSKENDALIDTVLPAMENTCMVIRRLFNSASVPYRDLIQASRDVDIILTIRNEHRGEGTDDYGTAYDKPLDEPCYIVIWGNSLLRFPQEPTQKFEQLIAHEMVHCFYFQANLNDLSNSDSWDGDWWVEGGAEYFSNVVYPTADFESEYIDDFDINSPQKSIVDMSYEAFLFFQYLENRKSDNWIVQLLIDLPKTGRNELIAHLSKISEMHELFHDFGKAYLDGTIVDTSGELIQTAPKVINRENQTNVINMANIPSLELEAKPFLIQRYRFEYEAGKKYSHTIVEEDGDGLLSAREKLPFAVWNNIPSEVATCNDQMSYVVLVTTSSPQDYSATLETEVSDNNDCSSCDISNQDMACLVGGTWEADLSQWLPYYIADAEPDDVNVTGMRTLKFSSNNTATYSDTAHKVSRGSCDENGCDGVEIVMEVPQGIVSYEVVDGNFLTSVPTSIQGNVTITLVGGNNDNQGTTTPLTIESLGGSLGISPAFENQPAGIVHGRFQCTPRKLIICAPEGFYSIPKETIYTRVQ